MQPDSQADALPPQIYCDPLTKEPEFVEWINEQDEQKKIAAAITPDMLLALDRFFFNHYCNWFRSGAFGESISKIPMLNICDDHVSAGMSGG